MRIKIFFSTLLLSIVNVGLLYAQDPGLPCGGNDDDNNGCPLDTWVVLLAFVAIVIAAWHLNNKRKAAPVVSQNL